MSESESAEGDDGVFYFESDHLALRGNRDYAKVLRCIALLEAQRCKVHTQLEELALAKKRYLDEPELLLEKLRKNEELIAPHYMSIANIPEISAYDGLPPEEEPLKVKEEPDTNGSSGNAGSKQPVVRGRIVDNSKPRTFNQLWTFEEQRRLEQLLAEFPFEEVENRRFIKIAAALGNRTPQQVASRCQKYFQKLHDAGMPIPGRKPKNRRIGQTKPKHIYRPSTFFPAHNVPVHMPEDEFLFGDYAGGGSRVHSPAPSTSNYCSDAGGGDYLEAAAAVASSSLNPDERRRVLQMLKTVRDEKRNTPDGYQPDPLMTAKCEACQHAPVSSTRWRCNTCYCYLHLCGDCLTAELLSGRFEHIAHDVVVEHET